jgi:fucose 4-O-acetylase-like acetyltransferase
LREGYEDYARAAGIVLVVYGHVLRGLVSAGLVPSHHWILQSDYAIYTFHMPLFFVLSGLHVERSLRRGAAGYLASKLQTIVYPYFLWSLVQGLVLLFASGETNHPFYPSDLVRMFWDPFSQFWFLYALFLCHILIVLTTTHRIRLVCAALVAYAIGSIFDIGILALSLKFFLFFAAGVLLAGHVRAMVSPLATVPGMLATAVALGVAIYLARPHGEYNSVWALPATALGILLVFEFALWMDRFGESVVLTTLGQASMPIYLVHILAGSGARIVLMHLHVDNLYVQLFAGVICGLAVPLVLYLVVQKLQLEKVFGFPKGGSSRSGQGRPAGALN